jgi:hypothetical protein
MEENMDEFYERIEEKIKDAGYPGELSGFDVYDDISNLIEDMEDGEYTLSSKELMENDGDYIEYTLQVFDSNFNLSAIDIHSDGSIYHVDFE